VAIRVRCAGCGSRDLDDVLDLGKTPLADVFPASPDDPEVYYPLVLLACQRCTLVQLRDVVPDALLYGADYAFHSSASPALVAYHEQYAQWLLTRYLDLARRLTVEIACNDGSLLSLLDAAHCPTVGIDPATAAVNVARGRGLTVEEGLFSSAAAYRLLDTYGPAGLIVANNVLAHVADIRDMLTGIAHLLADDGIAVVEFQYLPDLLAGNQFDHVYHEHRFYLSLTALLPLLRETGLHIAHAIHTPMQGGSLRLSLARQPGLLIRVPREADLLNALRAFQPRVDYVASRIRAAVDDVRGTVAGYGATAKSATLLSYCQLGDALDYVVDTTPGKIGRYTPGTHIPVVAPGERPDPDVYLVTAWNYLGRILNSERAYRERGGRFLVPIPIPVLL
jgi:SAM-dependent methyltransferase